MPDSPDPLHEVVLPFADDIADLLTTVFGIDVLIDVKELRDRYVVRLDPPIELTVTSPWPLCLPNTDACGTPHARFSQLRSRPSS